MVLRSLASLLISVMLVLGCGDDGRATRFSPLLAGGLGGFDGLFDDSFLRGLLGGVERFATLPEGSPNPEGIAADKHGNIYVATFSLNGAEQSIHIFRRDGRLRTTIPLPGVLPLGLAFGPGPTPNDREHLYVADFGNGRVLRFEPPFTASSTAAQSFQVCDGAGAGCGLNALAFDDDGDLYASDSFGGRIFKIELPGGTSSVFFEHPTPDGINLLAPGSHGFPPFGANGLAFKDNALFIANTADDRILKLDLTPPLTHTSLTTFAESINGADGILFDDKGRLWVAANQGDEVVALNEDGRVVERRGASGAIRRRGGSCSRPASCSVGAASS